MEEIKYDYYVNNDIEKTLLKIINNSNLIKHKCTKVLGCECEPYGFILIDIYYQITKIKMNKSPKYFNIFNVDLNFPFFTKENSNKKQQITQIINFIFKERTTSIYDFLCIFYEKPQINISINLSIKIGNILIKQSSFNEAKNHSSYYLFYSGISNNNSLLKELVSVYNLIFECILKLNRNYPSSYLKTLMIKEIKQVYKNKELYDSLIKEINKLVNNLNEVSTITLSENEIKKETFGYNSYSLYAKRLEYANSKITMIRKHFLKYSLLVKREIEKSLYFNTQNDILGRVTEIILNKNILLILIIIKFAQLIKLMLKSYNINLISPEVFNKILTNTYMKTIVDVLGSFYKIIIIN